MLYIVCKHYIDWTVSARTVKLGTHTTSDKRMTPIAFKVKGQCHMLLYIVVKACKHDTDWTVSARTVELGTLTTYDKRIKPIALQGHGSKVKVTLLLNLVNNMQKDPFQLALSNLVHILLMTRGWHLLLSRSKVNVICYYTLLLNRVNMIQIEPFQLG